MQIIFSCPLGSLDSFRIILQIVNCERRRSGAETIVVSFITDHEQGDVGAVKQV